VRGKLLASRATTSHAWVPRRAWLSKRVSNPQVANPVSVVTYCSNRTPQAAISSKSLENHPPASFAGKAGQSLPVGRAPCDNPRFLPKEALVLVSERDLHPVAASGRGSSRKPFPREESLLLWRHTAQATFSQHLLPLHPLPHLPMSRLDSIVYLPVERDQNIINSCMVRWGRVKCNFDCCALPSVGSMD
jgi:hypothetical protein